MPEEANEGCVVVEVGGIDPVIARGAPASAGTIFALLRSGRASTRTDLRRLTGLSRTAVVARVTHLVEAGLLLPGEELASTGGRPPGSLVINREAGVVLAVAVGRSRSQVGVFDLLGTELSADSMDHAVGSAHDTLMPAVVRRLAAMLEGVRVPVLAIGLSLPGTVDEERARSLDAPVLPGWDGVPLADYFAAVSTAPLIVGNDADVLARSELLWAGDGLRDALVLKASTGLSLGIVTRGRVLHGHRGGAGDLGHVKHDAAAERLCRCGATGCLEAVAGGWALVEALADGPRPITHVRDLVEAALEGDSRARAALREAGRLTGEVLAAAVTLLNPQRVVVGGDMAPAFDIYVAGLRETVFARTTAFAARDLEFVPAHFAERAGLVGCAALALDRVLSAAAVDAFLAARR